MHYENWSGWMGLHMLFWLLLLIVLIVIVVRLLSPNKNEDKSAKQILDRRYAKGEISKDEYVEMLKDLEN